MNVDITVRFHVISEEQLDSDFQGDLESCVKQMLKNEGLFGVVEDKYRIIDIERGDD